MKDHYAKNYIRRSLDFAQKIIDISKPVTDKHGKTRSKVTYVYNGQTVCSWVRHPKKMGQR